MADGGEGELFRSGTGSKLSLRIELKDFIAVSASTESPSSLFILLFPLSFHNIVCPIHREWETRQRMVCM
jgi:hypothetical protein